MSTPEPQHAPAPLGGGSLRQYLRGLWGYPPAAWKAAVACVLAMALSPAALVTTVTFLIEPVARDFGWSQSQTLTLFNIPTVTAPFVLPVAGRLVDRFGARVVAVPGTALYAVATAAAGVAMSVRLNAVSVFGERGYSASLVSLSVSVLLVASVVGQILAGVVLDRSRAPRVFAPFLLCLVIGIVLTLVAQGHDWALFTAMTLLGVVIGAESTVGPYLISHYFGLRAFGQIQGVTLGVVTWSVWA